MRRGGGSQMRDNTEIDLKLTPSRQSVEKDTLQSRVCFSPQEDVCLIQVNCRLAWPQC